ncbi:hypothetical protein BVRB_035650, partial [Beta vulgaris subsp. vulgaris]
ATMQTSMEKAASDHHSEEKTNEYILQNLTDKENVLRDQSTQLNKSYSFYFSNTLADMNLARAYEITRVQVASATAGKTRLEGELKTLPKTFESLQTSVQEAEAKLAQQQIEIDEKRKAMKRNQEVLSQALEFFNSRLGLFFERESHDGTGFRLKATFTCLGEDYSERASFCIDIDGGKYVVNDCLPEIDSEEIVQRLQKTDDLSH